MKVPFRFLAVLLLALLPAAPLFAKEALKRRDILRTAMEREGFFVYPWEWWHFDWKDFRERAVLDIPFSAIGARVPAAAAR